MAVEKKRARSDADKAARRDAILIAAREAMLEDGYDAVTMAGLARRAGLAKGTLYLYFQTKEEVLLWLYVEALEAVTASLEAACIRPLDDEAFIKVMMKAVTDTPLFLAMNARLTSVIELNTSCAALIEAKREMMAFHPRIAGATERALDLPAGAGFGVSRAISVALQGASQLDLAMGNLDKDLPDDVRAMVQSVSFEETFPEALSLIIKGAR
ncbi:MAG: TetR/AcrR family transcriptional regulator [Pseudomonadota bacterium]